VRCTESRSFAAKTFQTVERTVKSLAVSRARGMTRGGFFLFGAAELVADFPRQPVLESVVPERSIDQHPILDSLGKRLNTFLTKTV
jgi:hypothetical protein